MSTLKKIITGSLIYYLPIVGNVLLSVFSYLFLSTQEATIVITSQFLAAAGVGVYGIVCGQATIVLAKQKIVVERFLLRLFVVTFPAAIVGMISLALLSNKTVSSELVLIASALTVVDGILLIFRSAGFTRYLNRRSKISSELVVVSLLRVIISVSPLMRDIKFLIYLVVVISILLFCYAIIYGVLRGGLRRRKRVAVLFQGNKVFYLLVSGFLNGLVPFLLMLGVEQNLANENLTELFILRIALTGNLLIRACVDLMLATKRLVFAEIGLSFTSIILMCFALISHRTAILMAVLPSLAYVAKSAFLHNLIRVNFNRTLISPSVLVFTYPFILQFASPKVSIILSFIMATVSYAYFTKQFKDQWNHTFFISIACMGVLLYAA
ncbi:MAG TPA: hypothetical protein DDW41_02715 [Candidatus Andersenbacteria bacterium]|nr:hypothetical protein [Candidatus Andersenbacteria bacterium]